MGIKMTNEPLKGLRVNMTGSYKLESPIIGTTNKAQVPEKFKKLVLGYACSMLLFRKEGTMGH